ncbi:hypothetical protein HNR39_002225 [Glaciimonas immobilis]|uniref:Uncharacterized protein n=1 Tax=Glaciimonas immobilis TaxID=728004 RepID=A0A840RV59_9BURK|nr:hypothetical protein [Glaciimonas immobilis]
MAIIRVSPTEITVDDITYVFDTAYAADAFEACVAITDVPYCVDEFPPVSVRKSK